MALRGDLASVDLAQVFQMLALNQKVGLLSIQSRQLWKVLAFDHRGVTAHHNVHAVLERVVASFVRSGRLTDAALEEVRDHAARTGQALTDGLLAGGFVDPAELEEQYRTELEEEIYDLFFCRDARFEFHEAAEGLDGFDGQTDERFFFHCDSIVMEAARRIDEWAYISERVPSTDAFFVAAVDSITVDEFGSEGASLFELLDGRRSVQRLIDLTGLSHFQACKAIGMMLDAGAIAAIDDEDLLDMAAECEADDERLVDAINLYERATVLGVGGAPVHSLAAAVYRAADRPADAARHLEAEAELLAAAGDDAGAAARLLEIRELLPTALGVRERLVELTVDGNVSLAGFDALAEGKEVVELLLELGDVERVRRLLEQLLAQKSDDIDLKKALVSVHIKAGDQQRVAELYESIADDLVEQGHPLEAVGYLQKILLMDRGRSDISERVRGLYEHDERSRKRSRLLGVFGTLFFLLAGAGTFYWFYSERADEEYARIDVREMLEREDFAGAAMAYGDFMRRYPLTTAVTAAQAEVQQIEAARQKFEAKRDNERAVKQRELEKIRSNYKRDWGRHRELFLGGDPEQSLEVLERVRELLTVAGEPADVEWAYQQQVERSWERLSEYLRLADGLVAEYEVATAAADWEQARELALRLKSEFENTAAAARAAIPVEVRTRPGGARLLQDGKPLMRVVDGVSEPLITPTVVLCADANRVLELVADLVGFEPRLLQIAPREEAGVDAVLAVLPSHRLKFESRLQTGLGMTGDWLAAGLRGGRLGISRTDGTDRREVALAGLMEVDATPHIDAGRAWFVSNEHTIECYDLQSGTVAKGWPVPLPHGALTELVVARGRVAVVDGESVLHCWEQTTGSHLWSLALGTAVAGPPTISQRSLYVATRDGRVFLVDLIDGKTKGVLRSKDQISTRVLGDGSTILFGCANGTVRLVDISTGRVLWSAQAGAPIADGCLAFDASVVCAAVGDRIHFWARGSGELVAATQVNGTVQPGIELRDGRLYVRLQREGLRNNPVTDVLQAIDVRSREVLWEFSADKSPRAFAATGTGAAFIISDDTVVVFR